MAKKVVELENEDLVSVTIDGKDKNIYAVTQSSNGPGDHRLTLTHIKAGGAPGIIELDIYKKVDLPKSE